MNNEKNSILVLLGCIILIIGLTILGEFIISGHIMDYGSPLWLITLPFLFILLSIGFVFLYLGINPISLRIWIRLLMNNEKDIFLVFLGWLTLMVGLMVLGEFVISRHFIDYGTPLWLVTLFFLLILLLTGFGFLYLGGDPISLHIWAALLVFSCFFISFSLYLFLGWTQIEGAVSLRKFVGITALFLLSFSISPLAFYAICSRKCRCHYLKAPSYFYGVSTLILLFMLINKYILKELKVEWDITVEAIILMVGASIFLLLQMKSREDCVERKPDSSVS